MAKRPPKYPRELRGQRLRLLREKLDLTQDQIAQLSEGKLHRTDVIRAERDEIKWGSDRYWTGFGKAFNLDRQQMEDFLDAAMPINDALVLAHPRAKKLLEHDRARREVDAAAREALSEAGLSQEELAPSVLAILQVVVRDEGPGVNRVFLVEEAKRILSDLHEVAREASERAERARGSHKKDPHSSPRRR